MEVVYDNHFPWDDVDFTIQASCGVDKCFWPSVSEPQQYGYLITAEGGYDGVRQALVFAQHIAQVCSARHLFLPSSDGVVLVNVTMEFMQDLAQRVHNPSRVAVGRPTPWVFYKKDTRLTVQKVIRAPVPHLLYGTYGTKWDAMIQEIPKFQQQLQISLSTLRQRLEQEKKVLQCVLEKAGTMYWHDTQGLIDVQGRFYHIDLDHHFHYQGTSADEGWEQEIIHRNRCLDDFQEMIEEVTTNHDNIQENGEE
jgi:hypothetical protein